MCLTPDPVLHMFYPVTVIWSWWSLGHLYFGAFDVVGYNIAIVAAVAIGTGLGGEVGVAAIGYVVRFAADGGIV